MLAETHHKDQVSPLALVIRHGDQEKVPLLNNGTPEKVIPRCGTPKKRSGTPKKSGGTPNKRSGTPVETHDNGISVRHSANDAPMKGVLKHFEGPPPP